MARKRRNRRRQSSWAAQGDAETVIEFSRHRMTETLSEHQLEALKALAGLRELELQVQAFVAAIGTTASVRQQHFMTLQTALEQLPCLNPEQRQQLLDTLETMARSQPTLPLGQPPTRG